MHAFVRIAFEGPARAGLSRSFALTLLFLLLTAPLSQAQVDPQDVEIVRDTFGVPHIYGKTDAAAAYGLAWAHAEDDFYHIQLSLLNARGRLGEVTGKDGALLDFFVYFTGFDTLVEQQYPEAFSPAFRKVLEGYVQGMNAYARAHPKQLVRKNVLPFRPEDVIKGYCIPLALMAGMGYAFDAVVNDYILHRLGVNYRPQTDYGMTAGGSNALAVSANRSANGRSFLAVNSHQPMEGRFAWYEAHVISGEGTNILGGLFPGGVSIFTGTNQYLGWAHTNNYHNFGDLYELKINPENKDQYWYDGQWRSFRSRKVKLKVKILGGLLRIPVKRKILASVHGPVFEENGIYYAFRFPATMDVRAAEQWWRMNKATNLNSFREIMRMQAIPMFNTIYADVEQNIWLLSNGSIPRRNPELDWSPPVDGTNPAYLWPADSMLSLEELPQVLNPSCGYLYNGNNTPLHATCGTQNWQGDFPGLQRFEYNRGDRFRELFLELEGKPITWEDFRRIKGDKSLSFNGRYQRAYHILYELDPATYPDLAEAIAMFRNWDRSCGVNDSTAALAILTHHHISEITGTRLALKMILEEEVSEEVAVEALRKAQKTLRKHHGSIAIPLGQFQRHTRGKHDYPVAGHREVPFAMQTKPDPKRKGIFVATGGETYIQLVQFDSEEGPILQTVNCYGASHHPESPHYADQMEMFVNEELKPMTLEWERVLESAERRYHPGE